MRRRWAWLLLACALIAALTPVAARALCLGHACADEDCAYCAALNKVYDSLTAVKPASSAVFALRAPVLAFETGRAALLAASPVLLRVRMNN